MKKQILVLIFSSIFCLSILAQSRENSTKRQQKEVELRELENCAKFYNFFGEMSEREFKALKYFIRMESNRWKQERQTYDDNEAVGINDKRYGDEIENIQHNERVINKKIENLDGFDKIKRQIEMLEFSEKTSEEISSIIKNEKTKIDEAKNELDNNYNKLMQPLNKKQEDISPKTRKELDDIKKFIEKEKEAEEEKIKKMNNELNSKIEALKKKCPQCASEFN